MHYKNILVPYDRSHQAQRALLAAGEFLGENPEARIHILQAVDVAASAAVPEHELMAEGSHCAAELEKAESVIRVESRGVLPAIKRDRITIKAVANPFPADAIREYCEDNGCDLIVMGRRGKGWLYTLVGSVATAVLHEVDVPVITVK